MSKLGFDKSIRKIGGSKRSFLRGAIVLARKEFKRNFDTESDSESKKRWDAVLRGYPPPILDVTGELRAQAVSGGRLEFKLNSAHLTIDPLDERGRGYASYHQDGTPQMHQRRFVTQSEALSKAQQNLLDKTFGEIF